MTSFRVVTAMILLGAITSSPTIASDVPEAASGFQFPIAEIASDGYKFTEQTSNTIYRCGFVYHPGKDMTEGAGDSDLGHRVNAAGSGEVVYADGTKWGGVVIKHIYKAEVFYTQYGHVQNIMVNVGDDVTKGQQIAEIGKMGAKTAHLHFEVRRANHPDPLNGSYWQSCGRSTEATYLVFQDKQTVEDWYLDPLTFVPAHPQYSPEPPTPNAAPVAGFVMRAAGVTTSAPAMLTVETDPGRDEAVIVFNDTSRDPDEGDALVRRWVTTNTGCTQTAPPPCELSRAASFTWGFKPGGPYVVRLTVTDRAGESDYIEARIVVAFPALTATLFFDEAHDPEGRLAGASLDRLGIDGSANLRVLSYHGSFPPVARINSIDQAGTLLWQTPNVTGVFSIAGATLKVDARGRSYLGEGQIIYAYEADGTAASGWPLSFAASDSNPNSLLAGFLVGEDGSVYAKSGVFSSFSSFPSAVFRVEADGSPGWKTAFPDGAHRIGVFEGQGRDIYTVIEDQLVRLDHATGAPVCWAQTDPGTSPFGSFLAGAAGAYSARGQAMLAFDGTCFLRGRFDTAGSLRVLDVVADRVIAAESSPQASGQAIPKLIGTDEAANVLWINDTIIPELTWGTALQVHRGKTLYVVGADRSDPSVPLLFLVDADTGAILQRIVRQGVCDDICNVAVAPDGTIYLTQTGSTKIYRVRFQ